VAVEKGTKAVILLNLSVFDERTFNNLQTKFLAKVPRKEFFNTHACLHQTISIQPAIKPVFVFAWIFRFARQSASSGSAK
jgi:hypothetical protein